MSLSLFYIFSLCLAPVLLHELHYTPEEIQKMINTKKVFYNSAIRLQHQFTKL